MLAVAIHARSAAANVMKSAFCLLLNTCSFMFDLSDKKLMLVKLMRRQFYGDIVTVRL